MKSRIVGLLLLVLSYAVYPVAYAANTKPVAIPLSVIVNEDSVANKITLAGTDQDGDVLSYVIATQPKQGSVSLEGKIATYTPKANYSGLDKFTFNVMDALISSAAAAVEINVSAVNDPPVAQAQTVTLAEDTASKVITLKATDTDNTALTYSIATPPTNGKATLSANKVTYIPNKDFNGSDSFTFTASDGSAVSAPAKVTLTITPVNDKPVALAQTLTLAGGTSTLELKGTDVDGDALTYQIATTPKPKGTLGAISGNKVSYTAKPGVNSDTFNFTVSDGQLTSTAAAMALTINAVNQAPIATAQNITLAEDTTKAITLAATDPEGSALTYAISTPPTNGTAALSGNKVTYTPKANFNGSDSFMFTASDGTATSSAAKVSITVTPVNDKPIADAQTITLVSGVTSTITLSGSDVDGDKLTYQIAASPIPKGTLGVINGNKISYTPKVGVTTDTFKFTVNDGVLSSTAASVTITIKANVAPTATAQSVTLAEDTPKTITLAATDPDSPTLTYAISTSPTNGKAVLSGNTVTYTPNANFNGVDSFMFTASDGVATSAAAKVSLTVTAVNDAPVATVQAVTLAEDTPKVITLTATDPDSLTLTYAISTPPTNGKVVLSGNSVTYTPNANFNGTDSFLFTASDGIATSAAAKVSLTITAVNDAPTANAQTLTIAGLSPVTITLSGNDVDGDALIYAIASSPVAQGTVVLNGNSVTYTPKSGVTTDTFAFTVKDASLTSAPANITINNSAATIVFNDPNLLGCFEGAIPSAAALATLQTFTCDSRDLSTANLAQLANLPALRNVALINANLSNISALANLKNLLSLTLSQNALTDISALSGLTQLQTLKLDINQISTITALSNMPNLVELDLAGNQISAITPLSGKTTLTKLYLDDNMLTDITPLSGLVNLTHLGLGYNKLSTITPLATLTKLQVLVLDGNNLNTITTVSALKALQRLYLSGNLITDISSIAGLTSLQTLELGFNQISTVSALTNLKFLTRLGLAYNSISSVTPLANLTLLQSLDLESNLISSVSDLTKLTALKDSVYLQQNRLLDISALGTMSNTFDALVYDNCLGSVSLPTRIRAFGEDWQFPVTRCAVSGVNNTPVAYSKTSAIYRNTTTTITLDAVDPDNDALTYTLTNVAVANGSLNKTVGVLTGNTVTFTPTSGYLGTAGSFSFSVKDSKGAQSGIATIQLQVIEPPSQITDTTLQGCFGGSSPDEATLTSMTTLSCGSVNLAAVNWQDLADLPNLKTLDLNGASLVDSDITEILASVPNLRELKLDNNLIVDFSKFANFKLLETLTLENNKITDLSSLTPANFPSLLRLKIGGNPIANYNNLAQMTNLIMLIVDNAKLTTANINTILPPLTHLLYLDLRTNNLTSVQALTGLTSLDSLLLDGNQITDVNILSTLGQLTYFWVTNNRLTTVSLPSLSKLADLRVTNNCLSSAPIVPVTTSVTGMTTQRTAVSGVCPAP